MKRFVSLKKQSLIWWKFPQMQSRLFAGVMDYGKSIFEKKKQIAAAKKNQKQIQVKEIKFRPRDGGRGLPGKTAQPGTFPE